MQSLCHKARECSPCIYVEKIYVLREIWTPSSQESKEAGVYKRLIFAAFVPGLSSSDRKLACPQDLRRKFAGRRISRIPVEELDQIERLFANVEGFYQSHVRLVSRGDIKPGLPKKQKVWFQRVEELRDYIDPWCFAFTAEGPNENYDECLDCLDALVDAVYGD